MIPSHTPEQIFCSFIEKNKKILHIGGDSSLTDLVEPSEYRQLSLEDIKDIKNIPSGYDYIVVSDALEYLDDPVQFIRDIKSLAKKYLIFEFKYDDPDWILDPNWKRPWSRIGLEYTLSRNFDYLNQIFLQHGTIHICHTPYNQEDDIDVSK